MEDSFKRGADFSTSCFSVNFVLQAVLIGSPQPVFTPTTVDYGRRGRRNLAPAPAPLEQIDVPAPARMTIRDLDMDLMMGMQ